MVVPMYTTYATIVLSGLMLCASCKQMPDPEAETQLWTASRPDLYDCEGCETAAARTPEKLDSKVHLPPEGEPGDRLVLAGRVLMPDGVTPAARVVLYFHQTNSEGYYRSIRSTAGGGPSDGMIQGWLATDSDGRYEVSTIRPAPYPDGGMPAHIHVYVKEPERRPYYLDDFVFEGDPHVDGEYRASQELRGGSGILRLQHDDAGSWRGRRDIILEP